MVEGLLQLEPPQITDLPRLSPTVGLLILGELLVFQIEDFRVSMGRPGANMVAYGLPFTPGQALSPQARISYHIE